MPVPRPVSVLVTLSFATLGSAQSFAETLDVAEAAIVDGDWAAASTALMGLDPQHGTEEQQMLLGARLLEVGRALFEARQFADALAVGERRLAVWKHVYGDMDHEEVAMATNEVALCLQSLGRWHEALACFETALAMATRVYGEGDHAPLAAGMSNAALCLQTLGRAAEALPRFEAAAATLRRLCGDGDHPDVATSLTNLGGCLQSLGRANEALPMLESALAMRMRVFGDRHPAVAESLHNVVGCLESLGRFDAALAHAEAALALRRRICGDRDHPSLVDGLQAVGRCLHSLGRLRDALVQFEAAEAIARSLCGDRDHQLLATAMQLVGRCFDELGRPAEALSRHEATLAMQRRLCGDRDHIAVASCLNNVAACLATLGRPQDALPLFRAVVAMRERLWEGRDHEDVARAMNNFAGGLLDLGRAGEARAQYETVLAMRRRLHGDRDHPDVAMAQSNLAACLDRLGRAADALPLHESALAMRRRLYGSRDHDDVATNLNNLAACLVALGRTDAALPWYEAALAMRQRVHEGRDHAGVVQSLNNLAACLETTGKGVAAMPHAELAAAMVERIRDDARASNELRQALFDELKQGAPFERLQRLAMGLGRAGDAMHAAERSRGRDLLDLLAQRGDPDAEAQQQAKQRGDEGLAARLREAGRELEAARAENDRLLHQLATGVDRGHGGEDVAHRARLVAESRAAAVRVRQLHDERARLLGEVLPVGRVRTPAEIRMALRPGELLLEFTLTAGSSVVYVLGPDAGPEALPLPDAAQAVSRHLPGLLQRTSRRALEGVRGRDPDGAPGAGAESGDAAAVFRALIPAGLWQRILRSRRIYVAAHRELHRLPFELLAAGSRDGRPVPWLEVGPPISYVPSGSVLWWLRQRSQDVPPQETPIDVVAVGDPSLGAVAPAATGVGAAVRGPADAVRAEDLERLRRLQRLQGAKAEAEAIAAAWRGTTGRSELLLGEQATESAVFDLAAKARHLHFACHGIAEEYVGQSLSMLVLAQSKAVTPDDDGFLKLTDILGTWRGRLSSCRLVVLSACSTNVGPMFRDEAPQALPTGFLFAGAPSVVSTLWAVDDVSTRDLMVAFHERLRAGAGDRLQALCDAKKALSAKYPDPFHWAPFLFMGVPD